MGPYRATAWALRTGLLGYLLTALGIVACAQVLSDRAFLFATCAWWVLFGFIFHRMILLREPLPLLHMPEGYCRGLGRFIGAACLIAFLPIAGAVLLFRASDTPALMLESPEAREAALWGTWAAGLGLHLILILLLGTALPAAVAGDRRVLWGALRRAPWTVWRVLLGLLLGPLLFAAASAWTIQAAAARLGVLGAPVWADGIDPAAAGVAVAEQLAWLLVGTLTAAVLCDAYERTAGQRAA